MILWQCSFDFLDTADLAVLGRVSQGTPTISTADGLVGKYLELSAASWWMPIVPIDDPDNTPLWGHLRFYWDGLAPAPLIVFADDQYIHCGFVVTTKGIQAWRASTARGTSSVAGLMTSGVLLGSSPYYTVVNANQWYSFEYEVQIDGIVGVMKTWLNGNSDLSLEGVDTHQSGETEIAQIGFGVGYSGTPAPLRIDDVLVGNKWGFPLEDLDERVGEVRVDCMKPVSDGTATPGFMRSEGVHAWELLDEPTTDPSDYIYSLTVGDRTSVNMAPMTNTGGVIVGVQLTAFIVKTTAGPCGFKFYITEDHNVNRTYSSEIFPSTGTGQYYQWQWIYSGGWDETNLNHLEWGIERTT